MISKPINDGGVLFRDGINLLIFKNSNNDITDKIQLTCPTHHNSNEFFSINKPTLMVYSKDNFYEPLCKLTRKNNKKIFNVKKFFNKII